jgi:hypothetical protein
MEERTTEATGRASRESRERASVPPPTTASAADETTYSRDDLLAGASGFGVPREAIAGALHLAGKGPEDRLTRAEMEAALEAYANHEVTE